MAEMAKKLAVYNKKKLKKQLQRSLTNSEMENTPLKVGIGSDYLADDPEEINYKKKENLVLDDEFDGMPDTPSKDLWKGGKEEELCQLWAEERHLYIMSHKQHRDPNLRDDTIRRFAAILNVKRDGLGVHTRSVESISLHTRGIHRQLREGVDIELPCTVIGDGYNPFTNPIVWHKVVGKTEMQINTASIVAPPFLDTKRYKLNYEMNMLPKKVNLGLVLKGVTLAESGTYRCEVLAPPDRILGNVTHTITVVAPIKSLTFSSNNTQPLANPDNTTRHQMTFDFVELMPFYVGCVAKGGHPKPTLRVYHEKTDITGDFVYEETNVTSGVPGLEVTSYSMSLTNAAYRAPVTSRGQHLRCVAKIHKASDLKRNQIALIEVKYGPRFECDVSPRAWPGDVNVTLTCRVTSNPVVELPSVRWRFSVPAVNETEEEVVLVTGEQARDGLYTVHTEMSAEGEVVTTLTIQNVTSDTFHTYRLEADNEVSNGHVQVALSEAFTTTEPTTQEVTTQEVTTRPPKDTILPGGDGNNKPAAAVTGSASSLQSTLRVVMLVLLVYSGVQSIF